jgi:hypothetical protein
METKTNIPEGQLEARTRWQTHASGEVFDKKKVPYLTEEARSFIEQQVQCIIAGPGNRHEPRGLIVFGLPGFVHAPDSQTCLLLLDRHVESSHLINRLRQNNALHLGLCFIQHTTRERLCIEGCAELLSDLGSEYLWLRLHVEQAFFHCPKYIRTRVAGLTTPTPHTKPHPIVQYHSNALTPDLQAFIAQQGLYFLCTIDQYEQGAVNHRGGAPGFMITLPPQKEAPGGTILLPDYRGNGAFQGIGNILEAGQAALLIPSYIDQVAFCITGDASVLEPEQIKKRYQQQCPGAERIIALTVQHIERFTGHWSLPLQYEIARSQFNIVESSPACTL